MPFRPLNKATETATEATIESTLAISLNQLLVAWPIS
jgi:hypothetical protein